MLGIRYLNLLADSLNLPLVICFTVGSNMGGHIGTLPLPNLIENYGSLANHIAVIGTGNEADQRHHYANTLTNGSKNKTVEIRVGENVSGFSMELWTDIPNTSSISIISPSGEDTSRIPFHAGSSAELDFLFERTKVSVDYRILVEKPLPNLYFSVLTARRQAFGKSSLNRSPSPTVSFTCGFLSRNLLTEKCIFLNLTPIIL